MDMDSAMNAVKQEHLPAKDCDDSCRFQFFEIVPLARDTDGSCMTNDVKEEPLQVEETDASGRLKVTDVVSLARHTDHTYAKECVSGGGHDEVKQDDLEEEPDDVIEYLFYLHRKEQCRLSVIEPNVVIKVLKLQCFGDFVIVTFT